MNLPEGKYRYYIFYLKDGLAVWVKDFFDEKKAHAKARLLTRTTGIKHFVQKTNKL